MVRVRVRDRARVRVRDRVRVPFMEQIEYFFFVYLHAAKFDIEEPV